MKLFPFPWLRVRLYSQAFFTINLGSHEHLYLMESGRIMKTTSAWLLISLLGILCSSLLSFQIRGCALQIVVVQDGSMLGLQIPTSRKAQECQREKTSFKVCVIIPSIPYNRSLTHFFHCHYFHSIYTLSILTHPPPRSE